MFLNVERFDMLREHRNKIVKNQVLLLAHIVKKEKEMKNIAKSIQEIYRELKVYC